MTTRAPSSAQRFAVAKPMPVPAAAVTSDGLAGEQAVRRRVRGGVGRHQATFGSGGRPRARSPMMLRWIWFEPP